MTASDFFTGTPPMFGPPESGAFAAEFTPKNEKGHTLTVTPAGSPYWHHPEHTVGLYEAESVALCIVAAQAWIRSRGYLVTILPDGSMQVKGRVGHAWGVVRPLSGQPDWLGAARWVHEQGKQTT